MLRGIIGLPVKEQRALLSALKSRRPATRKSALRFMGTTSLAAAQKYVAASLAETVRWDAVYRAQARRRGCRKPRR